MLKELTNLSIVEKILSICVVVIIAFFILLAFQDDTSSWNSQNSESVEPKSLTTSNAIMKVFGNESLCRKGAQKVIDSQNEAALQISKMGIYPPSYHFLTANHYVSSLDSCFYELHNRLEVPINLGGGVVDYYSLYVLGGPSSFGVDSNLVLVPTTVATCTQNESVTTCKFYNPKQRIVKDSGIPSVWVNQFGDNNAPQISYEDYKSLVKKYMFMD